VRFKGGPFVLISLGVALALAALAVPLLRSRSHGRLHNTRRGHSRVATLYVIAVALIWLVARVTPHALNLLLRLIVVVGYSVDPKLTSPGGGGTFDNADLLDNLTAHKLQPTSPLIDKPRTC
jgi:hypothetical protein